MLQLQAGLIVEQRAVDDAASVRQLAEIDIFGDGHLRDQMQLLVDNRHAGVQRLHGIAERHLLAADLQVASGRDIVAAENFQQRRFACAIFAHQRVDLSG
jgi:hypothetical protein